MRDNIFDVKSDTKYSVANVSVYYDEAFDIAHRLKKIIKGEVDKKGLDLGFILT